LGGEAEVRVFVYCEESKDWDAGGPHVPGEEVQPVAQNLPPVYSVSAAVN